MAVSDEQKPAAAPAPPPAKPAPPVSRPAPVWIVPLYVGGLVFVYLGERIIGEIPTWHTLVTGLGVAAALVATALRFAPRFRVGGERRHIEQLLAVLSVVGVVGLALYFATTDWGEALVHIDGLKMDTRERVEGALTVVWIALVGLSALPMLFAEGAMLPMRRAERPESRRVRAAAASGVAIALAAVYGALFVYAASGTDLRVDYSYFKTSRPSESTRKVAESLGAPVKVVAFFPDVNDVKSEVQRYLQDLAKGIPNLKVEIHDRLLVPKLARDLHANQDGTIVLAKGDVHEMLNIGTEMESARPKLKTLDRDFQEHLLKLVRSRRTAYLTTGHGELSDTPSRAEETGHSSSIVRLLLEKQNYLVKNLGIGQGLATDIPDDADMVLVLGPTQPFAPEEIASLRRYADRGGHLLLALDPDAIPQSELSLGAAPAASGSAPPAASGSAPPVASGKPPAKPGPTPAEPAPAAGAGPEPALVKGLDALAGVAGLAFSPAELTTDDPRYHVRRRANESDRTQLVTNRFSSHASVSTLSRNAARGAAVLVFGTGSLERATGTTDKVDFTLRSMPGTFADTNHDYKLSPGESRSTYNIAAAVTAPAPNAPPAPAAPKDKKDDPHKKPTPPEMRAFVIADADALSDLLLSQVMTNQLLFVDVVRWLGGEESYSGQVNTEEDQPIEHTKQKDLVWFYSTIFGAPALVLALGLVVSRRSRRRRGGKR